MSSCTPMRSQDIGPMVVVGSPTFKGRNLSNWGKTFEFEPAVIVQARSFDDVIKAVKDTDRYPTPVRPLGNIHSVTEVTVNKGGTVVMMRGLREVVGLGSDHIGETVTVQAGITLLELHQWLGKRDKELAVSPEIGDATVGSIVCSLSKDSGVGPSSETGTLYKAIVGVKYVDHKGDVVELTLLDHSQELAEFKSSDGLLGIVLEVTLRCFPQRLTTIKLKIWNTATAVQQIDSILGKGEGSNAFILFLPDLAFVETRELSKEGAKETFKQWTRTIADVKRPNFQHGTVLLPFPLLKLTPYSTNTYRRTQVNHYNEPGSHSRRLDFTWFEYPMERFAEVVPAFMKYTKEFAAAHGGFTPGPCATYFVERIPEKPHGWFSMKGAGFDKPGLSFTLDPIYHDPTDTTWEAYLRGANEFALSHGGRFALNQTRFISREQYLSCPGVEAVPQAPNGRFTTPYYAKFVKAKVLEEEAQAGGGRATTTTNTSSLALADDDNNNIIIEAAKKEEEAAVASSSPATDLQEQQGGGIEVEDLAGGGTTTTAAQQEQQEATSGVSTEGVDLVVLPPTEEEEGSASASAAPASATIEDSQDGGEQH